MEEILKTILFCNRTSAADSEGKKTYTYKIAPGRIVGDIINMGLGWAFRVFM